MGTALLGLVIQVETTLGALTEALASDLEIGRDAKNVSKLLDRCLLWLHEQETLTLGKGLTIFRPAMTIHLAPGSRRFTTGDFDPLQLHYDEMVQQVHVMAEYGRRGIRSIREASRLVEDYFRLERQEFLDRWMPKMGPAIRRPTTPESWHDIVGVLNNPQQVEIVTDAREQTNVLVLAGPGSGKTRVLVHRIAYLIRVRRENSRGILALVYNRHAATEIRRRLSELIGDDARGVTILTCHGLAMRLIGASFAKRSDRPELGDFEKILRDATSLLRGDGLSADQAEVQREMLIEGYRWILVDEYQDIGQDEYDLIAAVAGRSLLDENSRLSLFSVGDDDQNIYAFKGASVKFIRQFEDDYNARAAYLVENYRSTAHIIHAANQVIAPAAERMKAGRDIVINRASDSHPDGGMLEGIDAVGRGRVQIIPKGSSNHTQAISAIAELERLSGIVESWDWAQAAIIAREWSYLDPVRSYCEARNIPVQMANDDAPSFWRLRETQELIKWLTEFERPLINPAEISAWLELQTPGPWASVLRAGITEFGDEISHSETQTKEVLEWLAEWGRDIRKRQTGLLLLTAHRAKGLEFDDVVVLDGGWDRVSRSEDRDAARRLYYVAMTRARRSLSLVCDVAEHAILHGVQGDAFQFRRRADEYLDTTDCAHIYRCLSLGDVDLSFAGRMYGSNDSLNAIRNLKTGDPIVLEKFGNHWIIKNDGGIVVGRLAKKYEPPYGAKFVSGKVFAIVQRREEDSQEEYRNSLRRPTWEVVVPELIFSHR